MGVSMRVFSFRSVATIIALCFLPTLTACAAPSSFAGINFADKATPPPVRSLAARAQTGDKQALYELGLIYETGLGVPVDIRRARKLYRLAATTTGGTIYVYVPGQKGKAGYVTPVNTGPVRPGLPEAKARLKALEDAL